METIDFDYQNKDFDDVIYKIILNNITSKDLSDYFKKGTSESDKKKVIKQIKDLEKNYIAKAEKIQAVKKYLKLYFKEKFANYLVDYLLGYKELTPIMESDDFEDIMINDYNGVFVITRDNKYFKTNITFDEISFSVFLEHIKKTINRDFGERDFIDSMLPDNSRINIVSKNVSDFNVITIRKYFKKPLTIVDLLKSDTLTYELAAYLWTAVEGLGVKPANLFICGGTSAGKTTLLNVLLDFIPSNARIIGVEDTREINFLDFENSVSLLSNIADPDSLYKITINIMRMRPDRIIIGETRGKEAKALFMAMNTGHDGCISTIHANNGNDLIYKLTSAPMNIEDVYIKLLDIIVTINRKFVNNKMVRYVSQVSEISRMGNITVDHIYNLESLDAISRVDFMRSTFFEKLSNTMDISKLELKGILEERVEVLKKLVEKNITNHKDIKKILDDFSSKQLKF